jgi:hypothetical protein
MYSSPAPFFSGDHNDKSSHTPPAVSKSARQRLDSTSQKVCFRLCACTAGCRRSRREIKGTWLERRRRLTWEKWRVSPCTCSPWLPGTFATRRHCGVSDRHLQVLVVLILYACSSVAYKVTWTMYVCASVYETAGYEIGRHRISSHRGTYPLLVLGD